MDERRVLVNFRLPPDLVDELKEIAKAERRSLTGTVEVALREYAERFRRKAHRGKEEAA